MLQIVNDQAKNKTTFVRQGRLFLRTQMIAELTKANDLFIFGMTLIATGREMCQLILLLMTRLRVQPRISRNVTNWWTLLLASAVAQ